MDFRFTDTPDQTEQRRAELEARGAQLEREWQGHADNRARAELAIKTLNVDPGKANEVMAIAARAGALSPDALKSYAPAIAEQAGVDPDAVQALVQYGIAQQTIAEADACQAIIEAAHTEACAEFDALPAPPTTADDTAGG